MAAVVFPKPVMLVLVVCSRFPEAFRWARQRAEHAWGAIGECSDRFTFDHTSYYSPSMGEGLQKELLGFEPLVDGGELASIKRQTNEWEAEFAGQFESDVARPLNLDPGYVSEAKLVLATTKDRDHRIYLRDGIFAEVTLHFQRGNWQPRPWTYADYRAPEYHPFLTSCREKVRRHQPATGSGTEN